MRADRDRPCGHTEDSAPERLGSRGRRESSERARCNAASRSPSYREADSFNGRLIDTRQGDYRRRFRDIRDFRPTFRRLCTRSQCHAYRRRAGLAARIASICSFRDFIHAGCQRWSFVGGSTAAPGWCAVNLGLTGSLGSASLWSSELSVGPEEGDPATEKFKVALEAEDLKGLAR
jgi:hypothetical protein